MTRPRIGIAAPVGLAMLAAAAVLPPDWLADRVVPASHANRRGDIVNGLWLVRGALALNGLAWLLVWPWLRRLFASDPGRAFEAAPSPEDGMRAAPTGPFEAAPVGAACMPTSGRKAWSRREVLLCGAIAGLALAVRVMGLDSGLSADESYGASTLASRTPAHVYMLARPNDHPLIWMINCVSVRLLGPSEVSVRLASLVLGVAAVPAWFVLARRWAGLAPAVAASTLLALSPLAVGAAQDGKGYSLLMALAIAIAPAWLQLVRGPAAGVRGWGWYTTLATLMVATHAVAAAHVLGAHLVMAGVARDRSRLLPRWFAAMAIAGSTTLLLVAGAFPKSWREATGNIGSEVHRAQVRDLPEVGRRLALPYGAGPLNWAAAGTLALAAIGGGAVLARRDRALLATLILPLGVGLAANQFLMPYSYARYFIHSLPGYLLLAGIGGWWVLRRLLPPRAALGAGASLLLGWGVLAWDDLAAYQSRERFPFKALAAWLHDHDAADSALAGGFGADYLAWYAPEVRAVRDATRFVEAVRAESPAYLVICFPKVYAAAAPATPEDLGYEAVAEVICHPQEDGQPSDGRIFRRRPLQEQPPGPQS